MSEEDKEAHSECPEVRACSNCGHREPIPDDIDWCYVCIETDGVPNEPLPDAGLRSVRVD